MPKDKDHGTSAPVPKRTLLDVLATFEPLDEEFPHIEDLELDEIDLQTKERAPRSGKRSSRSELGD